MEFISPITPSLIQPVNQEVRAILKAFYPRRTFAEATATTEEDTEDTDAIWEELPLTATRTLFELGVHPGVT